MPVDKLRSVACFPELWQNKEIETVVQCILPNADARQQYTLYRAIGTHIRQVWWPPDQQLANQLKPVQ